MSRGINWFKDFKIEEEVIDYGLGKDIVYNLKYLNGDSTSFSQGNINKYQKAFKNYGNIEIPYINNRDVNPKTIENELIEPKIISEVCNIILSDCLLDKYDIKDRIEWFKEMSDKGYYISYDNE